MSDDLLLFFMFVLIGSYACDSLAADTMSQNSCFCFICSCLISILIHRLKNTFISSSVR